MLLQGCLNGARPHRDHPRLPVTPDDLAAAAREAVAAGAQAVHIHPRGPDRRDSVLPDDVAAAVEAVRAATDVPVGVTTGTWAMPDPVARLAAVRGWYVLPDYASVNFHEEGAAEVAGVLVDRGVGVEAGLWTEEAARGFVDSGVAGHCLRALLEPLEQDLDAALRNLEAIVACLNRAAEGVPRLLHGFDATAWAVIDEAAKRGYDTRIGLEDTLVLPDGSPAPGNGALVEAAQARLRRRS